jgi:hypothetical protein
MTEGMTEISVRGQRARVPAIRVNDVEVLVTGRCLRMAMVRDEDYFEGVPVENPEEFFAEFRRQGGQADIFSFAQRIPDIVQRYDYPVYWDNAAAISLAGYEAWWNALPQETRRNVRLAVKRGTVVSEVPFSDELVRGIVSIYNETPIRQGRRFWHYGKDFETVKRENGTFLNRSQFIAAYCGDELIGFIKMVYVGRLASIMQILSKASHHERRPTNAMIAKAVELAVSRAASHLLYCKYVYHRNYNDALTEFKRRNGFQEMKFPRYFVPLTLQGRFAVALRLQLGLAEMLPRRVVVTLLTARAKFNSVLQRNFSLQRV